MMGSQPVLGRGRRGREEIGFGLASRALARTGTRLTFASLLTEIPAQSFPRCRRDHTSSSAPPPASRLRSPSDRLPPSLPLLPVRSRANSTHSPLPWTIANLSPSPGTFCAGQHHLSGEWPSTERMLRSGEMFYREKWARWTGQPAFGAATGRDRRT